MESLSAGAIPRRGSKKGCSLDPWVCLSGSYPGDEEILIFADINGGIPQFVSNG